MTKTNLQKMDSILSRFHYNPVNLYGDRFKSERRDLLELLTGKRPLAKDCGMTILLNAFYSSIQLQTHTCNSHRETLLTFACAKLCNPPIHAKMIAEKNAKLLAEITAAAKSGDSISYIAFLTGKLHE